MAKAKTSKKKTAKKAAGKKKATAKKKAPAKKAAAKKAGTRKKAPAKKKTPASKKKPVAPQVVTNVDVEALTQQIGRSIVDRLKRRSPTMLDEAWWQDRMLLWAAWDSGVREQMYRFAAAYPSLRDYRSITRHLNEIYDFVAKESGPCERLAPEVPEENMILGRAMVWGIRRNFGRLARRFVASPETTELVNLLDDLRGQGHAAVLKLVATDPVTADDADRIANQYEEWLGEFQQETLFWPDVRQLDFDHHGPIPRLPILVQASKLEPVAFTDNDYPARLKKRITGLLKQALENGTSILFDVEPCRHEHTVLTMILDLLAKKPFRELTNVGLSIAADRVNAEDTLAEISARIEKRGTPIRLRLLECCRTNEESILHRYYNWPVPVDSVANSRARFERLVNSALAQTDCLLPIVCSHRLRPISNALALSEAANLPTAAIEFEFPMGFGHDIGRLLVEQGHRVRTNVPVGPEVESLALLAREMLRNPSCDFIVQDHQDLEKDTEELLMKPEETDATDKLETATFSNEPLLDFGSEDERDALDAALEEVQSQLGNDYALLINGRAEDGRSHITSRNPAQPKEIIGTVAAASADQVSEAIDAARRAWLQWAKNSTNWRAEYLELIAAEFRNRRHEMMAWCMLECGMCRADANREVTSAIDFCMYYAWQIRHLDCVQQIAAPGESTEVVFRSRGVAVIISPASSPLAVLAGMTAAAIVAGNTAVIKPAEQASVVAWQFADLCMNAGIPDGVVNLLTGSGEELGPTLAGSPNVDIVAFTGSRTAGMEVNFAAAQHESTGRGVKRIVAQLNGNNAAIVDDDVDIDAAVAGVMSSAFAFSGQQCFHVSRLITVGNVHDKFLQRFYEVLQDTKIGNPLKPATVIGPVMNAQAKEETSSLVDELREEEDVEIVQHEMTPDSGQYVPPTVISGLPEDHSVLEREFDAPILFVQQAKDFDQALSLANDYHSNLVTVVFSQSPGNLDQARLMLRTGNLFLNRSTNGPMVHRHPFGGFQMSGSGVQAGGPSYLQEFVVPVAVTRAD